MQTYTVKKKYDFTKIKSDASGVYEAENLKDLCDKVGLDYIHLETLHDPDILIKIYGCVHCSNYLITLGE